MSYEVMYRRIRFESFAELVNLMKDNDWTGPTLRYNGNHICGEVQIDFGIGVDKKEKEEFLKIANETLKIF